MSYSEEHSPASGEQVKAKDADAEAGNDSPAQICGVEDSANGSVLQIVNAGESTSHVEGWEEISAEERQHRPSIIGSHMDDDLSAHAMTEETLEGEDSDHAGQDAVVFGESDYQIGSASERLPTADVHEADSMVQRIARQREEDPNSDKWKQHKRHFFILSDAGKPIFSRYGDEDTLAPFMGVVSAVISFVRDDQDQIRRVVAGDHSIVFLMKGALYFVCASRMGEDEEVIRRQLSFVYLQLIMFLTRKSIDTIYKKKAGFDLRNLLGASGEQVLMALIRNMHASGPYRLTAAASFLFHSTSCVKLPASLRSDVARVLQQVCKQVPGIVYGFLLSNFRMIHAVRQKKVPLYAEDLLLLLNFVQSSISFRSSEQWIPICLPMYKPDGLVFAYVSFLNPDISLVIVSTSGESFGEVAQAKASIELQLKERNIFSSLNDRVMANDLVVSQIRPKIPELRHFIFLQNAQNQFISSSFEAPYNNKSGCKALFALYDVLEPSSIIFLHSCFQSLCHTSQVLTRVCICASNAKEANEAHVSRHRNRRYNCLGNHRLSTVREMRPSPVPTPVSISLSTLFIAFHFIQSTHDHVGTLSLAPWPPSHKQSSRATES